MTHPDTPDEFELALRRREKLLPQFESDIDGPDASVDRIVLARARAPFEAPREREPRYHRAPRWALPVALAATLLLSFTLVLQMSGRDTPLRSEDAMAMPAERAASAAAAPADVAIQRPPPSAPAREAPAIPAVVAPTAVVPAGVADASVAAVPMPAPPPPAPAAAMTSSMDAATLAASAEADAAPAMAAERRAAARGQPSAAARSESPAAWLERIEQQRAAGDLDAARRELQAFRQQYPDVPLPEPLRGL